MMRTDVIRKLVLLFLLATALRGDARDIYDYINRRMPTPVEFREVMENHPRERQRWAMALCEKITGNEYGLSPVENENAMLAFITNVTAISGESSENRTLRDKLMVKCWKSGLAVTNLHMCCLVGDYLGALDKISTNACLVEYRAARDADKPLEKEHPEYRFPGSGPNIEAYFKKWNPIRDYNKNLYMEAYAKMAIPYMFALNYHEQSLSDEECRVFRTNMIYRARILLRDVHTFPWQRKLHPDPFAETPEEAEARQKADIDRFRP